MDFDTIKKIFRDSFRVDNVTYERSPVLTVAHDSNRSLLYRDKYYSPLMDTIEDDLALKGLRCQSVSRIFSKIKNPVSYANVVSPEGGFSRALIRKRLHGALLSRGAYPYSKSEERVWHTILHETGAKKVIAIMPSRELCSACHQRGIWVADVQHGVMADSHPWYGVTYRGSDPMEWLPDAFLVWDQGSANIVAWASEKRSLALVYGSRWVSRFLNLAPDDRLVQNLLAENRSELNRLSARPTILLSLSWGCYNIPNGFMIDGLAESIKATSDRYNWLLRLHPNQLIGFASEESRRFFRYFENELRDHASWEWATQQPLPLVLSAVDLHLSWSSSVAIEAAQMGVRSALLDPQLRSPDTRGDYYKYYRERGMIDLVAEDRPSITRWIEANITSKRKPESFDEYDANYRALIDFLANGTPSRETPEGVPAAFRMR